MTEVMAATAWRSNAELIEACFQLGYLSGSTHILDPTYGEGTFWNVVCPTRLVRTDINPTKSPDYTEGVDFTNMHWQDRSFDAVVFDPPYKLNGTPTESVDERYGVHTAVPWQDRMKLCARGVRECARVSNNALLIKCQDQVVSGKVVWQTRVFAAHAELQGFRLVDQLHLLRTPRKQPEGRRQVHARRNYSTMLILRRT